MLFKVSIDCGFEWAVTAAAAAALQWISFIKNTDYVSMQWRWYLTRGNTAIIHRRGADACCTWICSLTALIYCQLLPILMLLLLLSNCCMRCSGIRCVCFVQNWRKQEITLMQMQAHAIFVYTDSTSLCFIICLQRLSFCGGANERTRASEQECDSESIIDIYLVAHHLI